MSGQEPVGSRARVERRWALLPPACVTPEMLPGWEGTVARVVFAPAMGAGFAQYDLVLAADGGTQQALPEHVESFVYVLAGEVRCDVNGSGQSLAPGGHVYMRPGSRFMVHAGTPARLAWFKKRYVPFGTLRPHDVAGDGSRFEAAAVTGDDGIVTQALLPGDTAWDMAVDLVTVPQGAPPSPARSHVAEHGLVLLDGEGLCHCGGERIVVEQGDCVWVGPGVPHALAAGGAASARWLCYRDAGRDVTL